MADEINPYRINALDKSMMDLYNKFTPGFMCVGRKPHTFGNGHHIICCGITSVLLRAQIFEGMDRP